MIIVLGESNFMVTKRRLIAAVLATAILTIILFTAHPIRSATNPYDPWADVSGPIQGVPDGKIDMRDLLYIALRFNTFGTPARTSIKIGLILATGGLGDKSFNDMAYASMLRAQNELGTQFDYAEPITIAEYIGLQRGYASTGQYELIVCVGFDQADALNIVAQEYPSQKFAIVDMVVNRPNVASLLFRANEGSFLTGVLAGMLTETGKVGFVGGMDIPLINDFYVGYKAGAEWANASATVLEPQYVGGWADPATAKEQALHLINDLGADSIFAAAGKSGLGALEACNESDINGFGVDSCQDYLYMQIVGSATKRVDNAIFDMIKAAVLSRLLPNLTEGRFEGGIHSGGVNNSWTGCSRLPEEEPFWENMFNFTEIPLPSDVLSKLMDARHQISIGNVTVPSAY